MKKNIAMRVAAILFILTMISTCAFSTTFAKYVTSKKSTDTARVAKWGVTIAVQGQDAFEKEYEGATGVTGNTVVTSKTDDLFAPGTSGTLITVDVNGKPEVSVNVVVNATLTLTGTWKIDHDGDAETAEVFYCPIVITVGETKVNGLNYADANSLIAAVDTAFDKNANHNANDDTLATAYDLTATWEWAISGTTGTELDQTDIADTALGNLANTSDQTFEFDYSVVVTQID